MHKRIEFYVRNPGYEKTADAMGIRVAISGTKKNGKGWE